MAGQPLSEHALRAARTYGAAADHYGLPSLGFWDRFGAATVSRLRLTAGASVLDLCCGAGASAIHAAHAVGPAGAVLGIDVAAPLLELARDRAAREGLANIEFRPGDAIATGLPDGGFDAVVCVFGVFFVPDMAAFVAEMWRLVRRGGVLAVTTWGPGLFEPTNSQFWEAVREVEPSLFKAFNPWGRDHHPGGPRGPVLPRRGARAGRGGRRRPARARPPGQVLGHRARHGIPGHGGRPQPGTARPGAGMAAERAAIARRYRRADGRGLRHGAAAGMTAGEAGRRSAPAEARHAARAAWCR
ncbi:MAG TPA: methyltransferase domain-containing protein [Streptosporangiaceae bacterium]|nr:methyltransferase domain-containing protein [Streptosporangiaceae bacterium]